MKEFVNDKAAQKGKIEAKTPGFGSATGKLRQNVRPKPTSNNEGEFRGQYRGQYGSRRRVRGIRKNDAAHNLGQNTAHSINPSSRYRRRHDDPPHHFQENIYKHPSSIGHTTPRDESLYKKASALYEKNLRSGDTQNLKTQTKIDQSV